MVDAVLYFNMAYVYKGGEWLFRFVEQAKPGPITPSETGNDDSEARGSLHRYRALAHVNKNSRTPTFLRMILF